MGWKERAAEEFTIKGRIANLLGEAWEVYARSKLVKRHAEQVLLHIQRAQELVMSEALLENGEGKSESGGAEEGGGGGGQKMTLTQETSGSFLCACKYESSVGAV